MRCAFLRTIIKWIKETKENEEMQKSNLFITMCKNQKVIGGTSHPFLRPFSSIYIYFYLINSFAVQPLTKHFLWELKDRHYSCLQGPTKTYKYMKNKAK